MYTSEIFTKTFEDPNYEAALFLKANELPFNEVIDSLPSRPNSLTSLFSSDIDGWKVADWRSKCIGKPNTITMFTLFDD